MLEHLVASPEKPARVAVVGAGGFVGSAIAGELRRLGVNVAALARRDVDLLSGDAVMRLRDLLRPSDSVVLVAAIAPAKTLEQLMLNLRMAEHFCAAVETVRPSHLLYVSSDAVYADDANPVTERSPVAPTTLHGMMHAARELMLKTAMPGPLAILRPTLIYGAADPHSGYGPNRFRHQAAKGEPITIFGDGEEKRDHVVVGDVARLVARILLRRSSGVLNAVTGISLPFADIARMVAAQFNPPATVKSVPRPGPRPHLLHRFFDITDCLKAFPDFSYTPVAEGLARAHRDAKGAADG
jgi:nucleoside-diphosphate-sugar epimerase